MLRIVVRVSDWSYAANIGGPGSAADVTYRTFDVVAPEVEAFINASGKCEDRNIIGVEVRKAASLAQEKEAAE